MIASMSDKNSTPISLWTALESNNKPVYYKLIKLKAIHHANNDKQTNNAIFSAE